MAGDSRAADPEDPAKAALWGSMESGASSSPPEWGEISHVQALKAAEVVEEGQGGWREAGDSTQRQISQ